VFLELPSNIYVITDDNSTTRPRWKCDLCPRVFRTFEEAVEHEQKCNGSRDEDQKEVERKKTFEFNGSIIPPPKNGKTYAPVEAVKLITSLTAKGTTERKELILLLLDKQPLQQYMRPLKSSRKVNRSTYFGERGELQESTMDR